jgi:SPP1 gp7 family putative phage head morphogenesis protein
MPHLSRYSLPKRTRRLPRPRQPDGVRLRYAAALKPFLAAMRALVQSRLRPLLSELVDRHEAKTAMMRTDAMPSAKRAQNVVAGIARTMTSQWPNARLAGIADEVARATSKFQRDQLFGQIKQAIGVNLSTVLDKGVGARLAHFNAENVSLIRSIQTRYLADVERVVISGFGAGARAEDIASELSERFDVAESNALRIARDQVGKLNGQLNAVRQQQLGIDGFVWRTAGDTRVRDEHKDLAGKKFAYDDPPDEGLPGEPINCRCYAEPDLAGVLDGA